MMASATQLSPLNSDSLVKRVRGIVIIWSVIAVAVTVTGLYAKVPPLAVQVTIASLTLAQILCFALIRSFREWTLQICMKRMVLFQSWRILPGLSFLYFYYSLGKFTFDFAVVGGIGDSLVALTVPFAHMLVEPRSKARWLRLLGWQLFALTDLVLVIKSAIVGNLQNPATMEPLRHFPMSLIPTILVPLTLFIHLISLAQIKRQLTK
jgi:hypothetical protein